MNDANEQNTDCFEIEIPFNSFEYLNSANCNIHDICRICLSEGSKQLFLLASTTGDNLLRDMYTSLTNLQVSTDDGLPSFVCEVCKNNVINCYEFKNRCIKSDCVLKSLLKGDFNAKDDPKDATQFLNEEKTQPINNVTEDNLHIKSEENFKYEEGIEDAYVCYLEETSGSDSETLCIVQNNNKDHSEGVEVTLTDADTLLKDVMSLKAKSLKKPKTHVCNFCNKRFHNTRAVRSHVSRAHASSRAHACTQCAETFHSDHDLRLHVPVHGSGPRWVCVDCTKEFTGRSMFRRHIQRHMEMKRYACETCGKPFAELYALRRHARVHTGQTIEKRHVCHLCDKRYSESSLLVAHLSRHTGVKPCVCATCGKAFPSARLLASHHLVHSDHKPYKCRYCDKRFRHESTRNTHHRTHTGDKPYVCATCGKRFIQNSNLTLHMRSHTGEKPYSCDTCGKSFSSGSTLKGHMRTHTGDKPFDCTVCGKRFASRGSLSAHLRQHSGSRPHACAACPRAFTTPARLRDHCRIHTGEKAFECASCTRKFTSKSHLIKHVKSHQAKKRSKLLARQMSEAASKVAEDKVEEPQSIQTSTICLTDGVDADLSYAPEMNLVAVDDGGVRIASAIEGATVKLYQLDQSLLQIHSSGGQVTISKITSKMTANF